MFVFCPTKVSFFAFYIESLMPLLHLSFLYIAPLFCISDHYPPPPRPELGSGQPRSETSGLLFPPFQQESRGGGGGGGGGGKLWDSFSSLLRPLSCHSRIPSSFFFSLLIPLSSETNERLPSPPFTFFSLLHPLPLPFLPVLLSPSSSNSRLAQTGKEKAEKGGGKKVKEKFKVVGGNRGERGGVGSRRRH